VSKTNEFIGTSSGGDVILHDDFDPETGQKDIYVESTSLSKRLFVRIMLSEYMDLASNAKPADLDSPEAFSAYYTQHFNANQVSVEDCGLTNLLGLKFHDYFTWSMGGFKYYLSATSGNALSVDADPSTSVFTDLTEYVTGDAANGVKITPNAIILSLDDYLGLAAEEREALTAWIYDTDGYAYWSQPLGKEVEGTEINPTTGLLLNKITVNPEIAGTDYYYAINVRVEAVDKADLPMWTTSSGTTDPNLGMALGAPSVDGSGKQYPAASQNAIAMLNFVSGISDDN
jgi:hypothetical protein